VPIIAIGGIKENDVEDIAAMGIHGIAVASAITHAENKKETVKNFMKHLEYDTLKIK